MPARLYTMPVVQPRRLWAAQRRVEQPGKTLGPPLARCARCTVLIGEDYVHRELYLWPMRGKKRLEWKQICATCATEDLGLGFGFCLVAERDWTHGTILLSEPLLRAKIALLAPALPLLLSPELLAAVRAPEQTYADLMVGLEAA